MAVYGGNRATASAGSAESTIRTRAAVGSSLIVANHLPLHAQIARHFAAPLRSEQSGRGVQAKLEAIPDDGPPSD